MEQEEVLNFETELDGSYNLLINGSVTVPVPSQNKKNVSGGKSKLSALKGNHHLKCFINMILVPSLLPHRRLTRSDQHLRFHILSRPRT